MFKLIRNNVPEIMKKKNIVCNYATIENEELYTDLLRAKLVEEVNEFLIKGELDELVDIYTVIKAVYANLGLTDKAFEEAYEKKLQKQGGFDKKYLIFLPDAPQQDQLAEQE